MPAKSKKTSAASKASRKAGSKSAKSRVSRTTAAKKSANGVKSAPATFTKSQSKNWWQEYLRQRTQFYQDHPNSQWLIGLLIVVSIVHFALLYTEYWVELF